MKGEKGARETGKEEETIGRMRTKGKKGRKAGRKRDRKAEKEGR